MKVYKLSMPDTFGLRFCSFPESAKDALMTEIENTEIGDKLVIEVIEMTEEEYSKLPEFDGW